MTSFKACLAICAPLITILVCGMVASSYDINPVHNKIIWGTSNVQDPNPVKGKQVYAPLLMVNENQLTQELRPNLPFSKDIVMLQNVERGLALNFPNTMGKSRLYNPAILRLDDFQGHRAYLVTSRASSWSLCDFSVHKSPIESLPYSKHEAGKREASSTIAVQVFFQNETEATSLQQVQIIGIHGGYDSYWCLKERSFIRSGFDDPRIFWFKNTIYMAFAAVAKSPSHHHSCQHTMMICPLQYDSGLFRCAPIPLKSEMADRISDNLYKLGQWRHVHQKNWVPFPLKDRLLFLYSIEPLIILECNEKSGECMTISGETPRKHPAFESFYKKTIEYEFTSHHNVKIHGGSPLVPIGEHTYLGVARIIKSNLRYSSFFYTMKIDENGHPYIKHVSGGFCIGDTDKKCQGIQIVHGIIIGDSDETFVTISFGVNDCESRTLTLSKSSVKKMLSPKKSKTEL